MKVFGYKHVGCAIGIALAITVGSGGSASCAESTDAQAKADEADARDPDVVNCVVTAITNHMTGSKSNETIAACSKVTDDPRHSLYNRGSAYRHIGNALSDAGNDGAALEKLTKSIELDPKDAANRNDRGDLYRKMRLTDKAMDDYRHAVSASTTDYGLVSAFQGMALIYNSEGQYDLAITYQTKVIELAPDLPKSNAYKNRGVMWSNKGDSAHAQADYAKAVDLEAKRK